MGMRDAEILFLPISGPRGASSRYRVFQFLPAFAAAGWAPIVHLPPESPERGVRRLIRTMQESRQIAALAATTQAVFIQKRLLQEALVESIASNRPLLFDFDDSIFTTPNGDHSRLAQRRVESRLRTTLSAARLVVTGNRYLCDYARQYAGHVIHLPTVVDAGRYPAKSHAAKEEIVIGWIGHSVNHPYLAGLEQILRKLSASWQIRLLVVSDRDFSMSGVVVENRRWSEAAEVDDILHMDIGIMPMPDDPWSRGKCGLKAIQYMAAGIPVVCAAVGANNEIVRDGIDGYCAVKASDWEASLCELCRSVELRQNLGAAARQRVAAAYSLDAAVPVMLDSISFLLSGNPGSTK